jgi:thermitase
MPKKNSEFLHPSFGRCRRVPSLIAVRWKSGAGAEKRAALLAEAGLVPAEIAGPGKADKKGRPRIEVNSSSALTWAETKGGKEVPEEAVEKLESSALVEWVSFAYRAEKAAEGPESLFTVNPARLFVSSAAHESLSDLGAFGLSVDGARTSHVHGLVSLSVDEVSLKARKGALSAAEALARALEERPGGVGAGDLKLENIPFVSPACHGNGHASAAAECAPSGFQVLPNDPLFAVAWGLQRINAPYAWNVTQGDPGVVVAVIDQGVELAHPDLSVHPQSWNASTDTPDGSPVGNHGTPCAGIAAAAINNTVGAVGVAGKCRVMAIATSTWADIDIAEGLYFAADHGAQVVSMSFGVYPSWMIWDFDLIRAALQYAHDKGLVLVAASGNENIAVSRFPGSDARTIGVGGSNRADERKRIGDSSAEAWWGACYGPDLDVVAPCLEIPTTDRLGGSGYSPTDYFNFFNGTSAATPHVAGLAALVRSVRPDLSNIEVREILSRTCDKISPSLYPYALVAGKPYGTWHAETGYGRINAERALLAACAYGGAEKKGLCEVPNLKLPRIPAECIAPAAPPWLPYDQCLYFYEPRFLKPTAAGQFRVIYEHCLRLLGRQQGPLLYTTTLLPGEKVTLYHYDRFRRVRSATARVSVHTSFRQSVSALWQSRRSQTQKQYQDLLIKVRSDDDSDITVGGMLFPVSWTIDDPDLTIQHTQGASVQTVAETFQQIAASASQQVDSERSLVVSTFEEAESKDVTSRTLENKNHCRAVTYFVRRVLEVYELHTTVKQLSYRDEASPAGAPRPAEWRPVRGMDEEDRKKFRGVLDRLPRVGAAFHSPIRITLPTDGALYEAEFAHCSSCEPERQVEVEVAIDKARYEARKVCLEAELLATEVERRKALLERGELEPFPEAGTPSAAPAPESAPSPHA